MIKEFLGRVISTQNSVKLAHWSAKGPGSYAKHSALGELYDEITDKLDYFVEVYQGAFGLVADIEIPESEDIDILPRIKRDISWIQENRDEISGDVAALGNIVDEIVGIYLHKYYKLENLK